MKPNPLRPTWKAVCFQFQSSQLAASFELMGEKGLTRMLSNRHSKPQQKKKKIVAVHRHITRKGTLSPELRERILGPLNLSSAIMSDH
jgi:hypothetical protein